MRFSTVQAWAKQCGSGAKTLKGQKKAIVASFKPQFKGRLIDADTGTWSGRGRGSAARYRAVRKRDRQEQFAARHPLVASSPLPATRRDIYGRLEASDEVSVLQLQSDHSGFAVVAGWVVRCEEVGTYNRNRYSKTYHAAYGGTYEVERRTVVIRRVAADGTLESRDVDVKAWRGNYLLAALAAQAVSG